MYLNAELMSESTFFHIKYDRFPFSVLLLRLFFHVMQIPQLCQTSLLIANREDKVHATLNFTTTSGFVTELIEIDFPISYTVFIQLRLFNNIFLFDFKPRFCKNINFSLKLPFKSPSTGLSSIS